MTRDPIEDQVMRKDYPIRWVIEEGMFSEEYQAAMKASVGLLTVLPMSGVPVDFPSDRARIFHGSIETAQFVGEQYDGWCTWANFTPSKVLTHWGSLMLNQDAIFVPCGELIRREKELRWNIGGGTGVFVRVDSSKKGFRSFALGADAKFPKHVAAEDPETMLLVSKLHPLIAEWRFVVCRGKIVSACQYAVNGQLNRYSKGVPSDAAVCASKAANHKWQPDPIYMLDVGRRDTWGKDLHGDEYSVVEVNPFSASDFYECDIAKIVAAANAEAERALETGNWGV